jgi:HAMP domain-containing protein
MGRLNTLNQAVAERIATAHKRQTMAVQARKTHEQFFATINTFIDDTNFEFMTTTRSIGTDKSTELVELLRRALEVQSEINLFAGLLTEASLVTERARLQPLRDLIGSAERKIKANLKAMPDSKPRQQLMKIYESMASFAGKDGIFDLRNQELTSREEADSTFAETAQEAAKLKQAVGRLVDLHNHNTQTLVSRAEEQIRAGRASLIVLAIVALIAAALVAWLYVARNLVRRLDVVNEAMRRIARGDTDVKIPEDGHDEIADMAKALLVFRTATGEVNTARASEIQRVQQAENRRQDVDRATAGFERTVSAAGQMKPHPEERCEATRLEGSARDAQTSSFETRRIPCAAPQDEGPVQIDKNEILTPPAGATTGRLRSSTPRSPPACGFQRRASAGSRRHAPSRSLPTRQAHKRSVY